MEATVGPHIGYFQGYVGFLDLQWNSRREIVQDSLRNVIVPAVLTYERSQLSGQMIRLFFVLKYDKEA